MKKFPILLLLGLTLLLGGCAQRAVQLADGAREVLEQAEAVPLPTPQASTTPKPSAVPKPTATPTPAPSASPAPTAEPSPAPTATATHVPAPAATPAPTATPSSSPIPTVAATASPIPLPSFTPTPTFTPYPESLMAPLPEGRVYWTPPPTPVPTPTPVVTAPPTPVPVNPQGQDIADYAMQFEGYNYLYAGKDPETGFDCSGLVWYVYRHFGIELNRTAAGQSLNGEHVEPDQLQPGDILCFYNWGSGVGHSGIALGGDWYIHAMDAAHGVVISALSDRTDRIEIRRVFE